MNKINVHIKKSEIEACKAFMRLIDTTQVMHPTSDKKEVIKNRFSHSYDVLTSAKIMAENLECSLDVDYQRSLEVVCLLHDIGHPAFGHEGQKVLSTRFKEMGLKEGFNDNNNNFVIIEKEQLSLEPYDLASLIKYPERLYDNQHKYLKMLEDSVNEDVRYFESKINIFNKPTRTVACEIMDEADRNSYVCSDLTDALVLGWGDVQDFEALLENKYSSFTIKEFLYSAIGAIKERDKSLIKRIFNNLKVEFNQNFILGDNLKLEAKNQELLLFREDLYRVEEKIFIHNEEVVRQRVENMKVLEAYIDLVVKDKYYPSKTYKKLIEASSGEQKLRFLRDMIAEVSDWYVLNTMKGR